MAGGRLAGAIGVLLAAGAASPALAELPDGPAPIGAFVERTIERLVELQAWPASCGPAPIASQIPGRGTVSLDLRGGALLVRSKRPPAELTTAACAEAPVAMELEGARREGDRWSASCRATDASRRQEVRATFRPPDDVRFEVETTFAGVCRGRTTEVRNFRRSVPTPAPLAEVPDAGAPPPAPDAGLAAPDELPLVVVKPLARVAHPAAPEAPFVPLEGVELVAPEEGGYVLPVEELRAGGRTAIVVGLLVVAGLGVAIALVRARRRAAPRCPSCAKEIPAEARFCPHCRAKLR